MDKVQYRPLRKGSGREERDLLPLLCGAGRQYLLSTGVVPDSLAIMTFFQLLLLAVWLKHVERGVV